MIMHWNQGQRSGGKPLLRSGPPFLGIYGCPCQSIAWAAWLLSISALSPLSCASCARPEVDTKLQSHSARWWPFLVPPLGCQKTRVPSSVLSATRFHKSMCGIQAKKPGHWPRQPSMLWVHNWLNMVDALFEEVK